MASKSMSVKNYRALVRSIAEGAAWRVYDMCWPEDCGGIRLDAWEDARTGREWWGAVAVEAASREVYLRVCRELGVKPPKPFASWGVKPKPLKKGAA